MNTEINENSNFLSILSLLCEATKLVRSHFLKVWKQKKRTEWSNDEEAGKFFLSESGSTINKKVRRNQLDILLSGNVNTWDLTLFGVIFSNRPFLNETKSLFVQIIRDKRNEIFHNSSFFINDTDFKLLWKEISSAMISLGFSQLDLNRLKNPENEKKKETSISNENKAKLIKEEANKEYKNENYEQAINLYSSAMLIPKLLDQDYSILYSNRAQAYLKLYQASSNKTDQRNLMRALNDAELASDLNPKWYKAFYRLGQVYKELNDLEKSQEYLKIALLVQPNDEDLKNLFAQVKYLNFEQTRLAHIDEQCAPRTTEENNLRCYEKKVERIGLSNGIDWNESLNFCTKKATEEDPVLADVWLAHEYRDGSQNVTQNYELAAKYYGKAASAGNAEAMYNLALMNQKGQGILKDFKTAFQLLNLAAQKSPTRKLCAIEMPNVGVAEAEHSLGIFYEQGIYVEKNESTSITWYKRAIEHGSDCAANNLGLLYAVSNDLDQAERMFILAHKRGDNNSISNLVDLYLTRNQPDNALLWHERALANNSLYDSCRDEDIRNRVKLLKYNFNLKQNNQVPKKSALLDPNRMTLIKDHRKSIQDFLKVASWPNPIKNTCKPPKKQSSCYSNLKEIKLKEIDFTKDHVLNGHKLKLTIVDVPCKNVYSIFFLVEDEEKYMERMAVYNLGDNFEKIKNLYPVGSRIIVMNPYIRMAADGKPMIRIDDPKSIVSLENDLIKMCRFCGTQDSKFNCSRCLNAFYCSQECQINDWKLLDHKLVCFKKN